jgi:hypothetical protein
MSVLVRMLVAMMVAVVMPMRMLAVVFVHHS